jgi:histidyl-tRNA synthetase
MFEDVGVFERVGEGTDVVRKEMYAFKDKGGRDVALRPEGTASLVRAYIQHRPRPPFKAWYVAPSFRHERPQAGRFRQHHQLGVEALGTEDPDLDVEIVALAWSVVEQLGLSRVTLLLNSLGDDVCRPGFLQDLSSFLEAHVDELCDEHRARYGQNPLRVLDCKRPQCQAATADAPRLVDSLCGPCREHFDRVQRGLKLLDVPFEMQPRLVRGLDYYTRTTFELQAEALDSAQNGVGGGGRYDTLAEALGGPATPGIGFGLGIERLLLACDAEEVFPALAAAVDVWVIDTTGGEEALLLTHELRAAGVRADRSFDARSMKAQFKSADRSGAQVAIIIGHREAAESSVTVRDLVSGEQTAVARDVIADHVHGMLR